MKKYLMISAAVSCVLTLSACSKTETTDTGSVASVNGARSAIDITLTLSGIAHTAIVRPPALLGIYANVLLADGLAVPVSAARAGVDVQLKINAPASERDLDDSYELLEEFGSILHVNVADLLNRSTERAQTLDEYLTGLTNITERSRRRNEDLQAQLKELKVEERDRRKEQTTIEREVAAAVKAKDFGTAGAKQRELIDAQERVTKVSLQYKEVNSLMETFTELLDIADLRIKAIDSNREILIAGLRAVDVPGVEDLNVIEGTTRTRKTRGSGTFGTF
jgi:hypothetical protein